MNAHSMKSQLQMLKNASPEQLSTMPQFQGAKINASTF